jgi:hypothetical protein
MMESSEPHGRLALARLRAIRVPEPGLSAAAVSLLELQDVKWVAPVDWLQQLLDVVGPTAGTNDNSVETTMRAPATFEIGVKTNRGVAQFITLQHELHLLIETWCEPIDPLSESQAEQLTREGAETRIREILAETFGVLNGVRVENAEEEQGSEWLFKFAAGKDHYVGTARRDHRSLLLHVAHPLAT